MAKKRPTFDSPLKIEPETFLVMPKGKASQLSIGDKVDVTVAGEVIGIEQDYADKGVFRVRIKNPKVGQIAGNGADRALREMKR